MSLVKILILIAALQSQPFEVPDVEVPPVQQSGWSTWYGDGNWHGSVTANGEDFDPLASTCASRTIPLGTVVLLEDTSTGNKVWCRVNDRGPYGALNGEEQWVLKLSRGDPGVWRGVMDRSLGTALRMKGLKVPDNLDEAVALAENVDLNATIRIRYWREKRPKKLITFIQK